METRCLKCVPKLSNFPKSSFSTTFSGQSWRNHASLARLMIVQSFDAQKVEISNPIANRDRETYTILTIPLMRSLAAILALRI